MKPQPAARASVASRGPWRAGGSDAPARGDRCRYQCGAASMGGQGWISTGSSSSGPRRLNTCTRKLARAHLRAVVAARPARRLLGGARRRNRNSGVRLSSAASCSRRSAAALPSQLQHHAAAARGKTLARLPTGLLRGLPAPPTAVARAARRQRPMRGRRAGAAAPPSRASDLQCSDASSAAAGRARQCRAGPCARSARRWASRHPAARHRARRDRWGGLAGVPLKRLPRHTRSPQVGKRAGRWRWTWHEPGRARFQLRLPLRISPPRAFDLEAIATGVHPRWARSRGWRAAARPCDLCGRGS